MLMRALEQVVAEDDAIDAALVFDELGNVLASASRTEPAHDRFAPAIAACISARAKAGDLVELRFEGAEYAVVVRVVEGAFVALRCRSSAPLGRLALRLRLHHDALLAAMP